MAPTNLQRGLKARERLLIFLIEDISLYTYLAVFGIAVLILGLIYHLLTPYGHGIGQNSQILSDPTFLQGLYFSVVTVSSLGYGDIHPMGISKAIACIEVIFGLAFLGIIIAKLTSWRISYHVRRLFSSDAQKRLEEFTIHFEQSYEALSKAKSDLGRAYQRTPSEREPNLRGDKSVALSSFKAPLIILHIKSAGLADYLSYEVKQGDYFTLAPVDAVERLGSSIDKGLYMLWQLILSLSAEARIEVLDADNRQRIFEILDSQKEICQVVTLYSSDKNVNQCFLRILETCKLVPESYFTIPKTVAEAEKPDLALEGSVEPSPPQVEEDSIIGTEDSK